MTEQENVKKIKILGNKNKQKSVVSCEIKEKFSNNGTNKSSRIKKEFGYT